MRLLVIRTSAMGDVALLTPVLRSMEVQFPETEIILLTRPSFAPFFQSFTNVKLCLADFNKKHSGIPGLYRLFTELKKEYDFDYVLDLHNVLRSKILRLLFRLAGVKIRVIDKDRKAKRELITGTKKSQLTHSVDRYKKVFQQAGFNLMPVAGPWLTSVSGKQLIASKLLTENDRIHIGISPYAKHSLKIWPEEYMIRLMEMIAEKVRARFWLFGGKEETASLIAMQNRVPDAVLVAGTLSLDEEIALMGSIRFLISMDSSNMHMAALTGTKVISIWGGTDPLAGFGAWEQPGEYSIRIPVEELTCRPCTVYGKGECKRGDFACMNWLTPEMVFEKLVKLGLL
jgi:ADP-heptose:LPS heptosyltransferase